MRGSSTLPNSSSGLNEQAEYEREFAEMKAQVGLLHDKSFLASYSTQ